MQKYSKKEYPEENPECDFPSLKEKEWNAIGGTNDQQCQILPKVRKDTDRNTCSIE